MRKIVFLLFGFVLVTVLLLPIGFVKEAAAEGPSIDIHLPLPLPPPPPRIFIRPPEIIVIPGSPVFVAPHPDVDIFFYNDYWWSPRGDRWYRSRDYNGHWKEMDQRHIPDYVRRAPRNYRSVYKHEHRIPYGQWKKQRKHMDKKEYRERSNDRRDDRKDDRRDDRWDDQRDDQRDDRRDDRRDDGRSHGHGHK